MKECDGPHHAQGLCSKHYQKLWKAHINEKCKVVGCEANQYTMGYCNRHYRQIKTHGNVVGNPEITKFDLNNIQIIGNICEITLRDYLGVPIHKAIVDAEDYYKVNKIHWHFSEGYVKDTMHRRLHNLIMGLSENDPSEIDHINHDGLDNRKVNLRLCSHAQNTCNKKLSSKNTSGYKGVVYKKSNGKWEAKININSSRKHLGYFSNILDAANAYDMAAIEYHGEFAATNKTLETLEIK